MVFHAEHYLTDSLKYATQLDLAVYVSENDEVMPWNSSSRVDAMMEMDRLSQSLLKTPCS